MYIHLYTRLVIYTGKTGFPDSPSDSSAVHTAMKTMRRASDSIYNNGYSYLGGGASVNDHEMNIFNKTPTCLEISVMFWNLQRKTNVINK